MCLCPPPSPLDQERHPGAPAYLFVEDKLSTLEKVASTPGLSAWQLYLVDWGYNTAGERSRAAADSRLGGVIGVERFSGLLTQQP